MNFDDRIWPKLLQHVCAEPLATIWFEPVADVSRGVAAGYRARPRFPLEGADYTDWLQAAERHGYRGRFAAATLTRMLQRRADLPAGCFLLAELDAAALTSDGVLGVLRRAGDLSNVVIEVTKFEHTRDNRQLQHALDVIREQDALVALRGTGTGHADPLQLADLAPRFVKVGSELIADIDRHPRRAAVLAVAGTLADQLDATIIADGVGRPEELAVLSELDVRFVGGPLIGGESDHMGPLSPAVRDVLLGTTDSRPDNVTMLDQTVRAIRAA